MVTMLQASVSEKSFRPFLNTWTKAISCSSQGILVLVTEGSPALVHLQYSPVLAAHTKLGISHTQL